MSESDIDLVWEIMDDIPICMVTTHAGGRMRSRPMHAIPDRDAGCVFFVTDTRGAKDDEIAAAPDVCLAFADIGDNTYLSVTGTAEMIRHPGKAEELWSTEAQAWWPRGPARSLGAGPARDPGAGRILGHPRQLDHRGAEAGGRAPRRPRAGSGREQEGERAVGVHGARAPSPLWAGRSHLRFICALRGDGQAPE